MQIQKILLTVPVISLIFLLLTSPIANAQMMGNTNYTTQGQAVVTPSADDLKDIATGKDLYTKFQNNQISCNDLKNADFEKIGEYLMDQRFGGNSNAHIQMNDRAKQMMGDQGEEQMHISIAERSTGCNTNNNQNWRGGGYPMMGYGWNNMMNNWGGFGIFGGISMILFWVLIILAVFALIRYLRGPEKGHYKEKTSIDILKERYAKGEIDKKEFEEKKKEIE